MMIMIRQKCAQLNISIIENVFFFFKKGRQRAKRRRATRVMHRFTKIRYEIYVTCFSCRDRPRYSSLNWEKLSHNNVDCSLKHCLLAEKLIYIMYYSTQYITFERRSSKKKKIYGDCKGRREWGNKHEYTLFYISFYFSHFYFFINLCNVGILFCSINKPLENTK